MEETSLNLAAFSELNAAYGALPMVVVVFDLKTAKVAYANKAASKFFGASQDQLTQRTTSSFVKSLSLENQQIFKEAAEKSEPVGFSFEKGLGFNSPNGMAYVHGCVMRLDDQFFDHPFVAVYFHEWNDAIARTSAPVVEAPQAEMAVSDFSNEAITDKLTGLTTRRILLKELEDHIMRAVNGEMGFTLIMTDLDRFSDVNSGSGSAAGDRVLKEFVDRMKRELRGPDKIYRVGGEEFVIILPNVEYAGAAFSVAERLRRAVELEPVAGFRITASFGLTPWDKSMLAPEDVLSVAEQAIERAKESGRNTVCKAA